MVEVRMRTMLVPAVWRAAMERLGELERVRRAELVRTLSPEALARLDAAERELTRRAVGSE